MGSLDTDGKVRRVTEGRRANEPRVGVEQEGRKRLGISAHLGRGEEAEVDHN